MPRITISDKADRNLECLVDERLEQLNKTVGYRKYNEFKRLYLENLIQAKVDEWQKEQDRIVEERYKK